LAPTDYLQDDLNQVTSREIPDDVDIMGYGVSATSTVTVDTTTADRWQKYFDWVLGYTNATDPVYDEFMVAESGQPSYERAVFLPEDEEEFTYDADGNLTGDGKWTYTWDAENRLATMETRSDLPMLTWGLDFLKIEFDYDYLGRRVQKRVYRKMIGTPGDPATQSIQEGGTAGTTMVTQDSVEGGTVPLYTLITSRQYVWDGWLCIAEIIGREDLKRSHTWGVDLSGSQQGVGGVGGLVFLLDRDDTTDEVYHCFYDGNGNLMSLRDDSQAIAAQYDYGPFGELLTARGDYAAENPYRFSTKYVDAETGLHYYGYRYYNSSVGRFLGRDPAGGDYSPSLYQFVENDPINTIDALGLFGSSITANPAAAIEAAIAILMAAGTVSTADLAIALYEQGFPPALIADALGLTVSALEQILGIVGQAAAKAKPIPISQSKCDPIPLPLARDDMRDPRNDPKKSKRCDQLLKSYQTFCGGKPPKPPAAGGCKCGEGCDTICWKLFRWSACETFRNAYTMKCMRPMDRNAGHEQQEEDVAKVRARCQKVAGDEGCDCSGYGIFYWIIGL
jgi:RHS repeat-associated protein